MNSYLPMDAVSYTEVIQYYKIKATELGASLTNVVKTSEGPYIATLRYKNSLYAC